VFPQQSARKDKTDSRGCGIDAWPHAIMRESSTARCAPWLRSSAAGQAPSQAVTP